MPEETLEAQPDIKKLSLATLAGVIILGIVVYSAYSYSQKKTGGIALPGGTTYLGQNPTPNQPPTAPLRFTADTSVSWTVFKGKIYPYSFSYPATLPLVVFPANKYDAVAIEWGNIPPQVNLLLSIEPVAEKNPKYIGLPKKEFVNDWYKFFSGLKGVSKIDLFTNTNGLKGYKAIYINNSGATPNVDVFFEVPNRSDLMIHIANGIIDPQLFDRIVDSIKWNTPLAAPTEVK